MIEVPVRRDGPWPVVAHVAALWVAGAVTTLTGGWLVVLAAFLHAGFLLVPPVLLLAALTYAVGTATRRVTSLTAGHGIRLLWALAYTFLSTVAVLFTVSALDALGTPFPPAVNLVLLTLPFPLVACAFVDRWTVRGPALVVLLTGVALCVWLPEPVPGAPAGSPVLREFGQFLRAFVTA
ncbi:hypothetical protein [Prauserella muralis]|uniref:Uncharacterized protein n=1 Tax=Prauserella muralis TaxID=588067 RepID=A0A2V4BD77_9PSEU|nr:hypothetical protein [Prauserella muralis]PXY32462.1 hypothetical protein BAY60_09395 [Prauserella muralis]TWE23839.1 hypothetical protein FHX69_5141 [Prauserella muralis]